ncbi:MAG: alcohol dehydrogenase catalytic domain-containing protein, partial [Desulfuromonadales bacterium]|nr:alcohol dehydrogenase catalytic domain-containing protein [Desulfuromonadales bacterium]
MRIKAAVLHAAREPLAVEEVELDPPRAGEVLVKVAATGICHTDVHRFTGDQPVAYPVVLGHEGAGIV